VFACGGMFWFMIGMWMVGRIIAYFTGISEARVRTFDAVSLSRYLFFCDLAYAPVSEVVLSLFSCLPYGDHKYVSESLDIQCGTPEYRANLKLGVFGIFLFPIGIPVTYLLVMFFYRVPQAALILQRDSRLRQLVVVAYQRDIVQPQHNVSQLTYNNISLEHTDMLYRAIFLKPRREEDDDDNEHAGHAKADDVEHGHRHAELCSSEELEQREEELRRNPYASFHAQPAIPHKSLDALELEVQAFVQNLNDKSDPLAKHSSDELLQTHTARKASRQLLAYLTGAFARSAAEEATRSQPEAEPVGVDAPPEPLVDEAAVDDEPRSLAAIKLEPACAASESTSATSFGAASRPATLSAAAQSEAVRSTTVNSSTVNSPLLAVNPEPLDALETEVQAFILLLRSNPDPSAHHDRLMLTGLYTEALLRRVDRQSSLDLVARLTAAFSLSYPEHRLDPADCGMAGAPDAVELAAAAVQRDALRALAAQLDLPPICHLPSASQTDFDGYSGGENVEDVDTDARFWDDVAAARAQNFDEPDEAGSESHVSSMDSEEAEARAELEKLTREQKLERLLKWMRSKAMPVRYTWRELREEHDVRRQDVEMAIGCLFEDYYPDVWGWKLYEVGNKLAITGALSFIAPGSTTQIVAGLGISFFSLLVFLRFLPYPKKTIRQLACACAAACAPRLELTPFPSRHVQRGRVPVLHPRPAAAFRHQAHPHQRRPGHHGPVLLRLRPGPVDQHRAHARRRQLHLWRPGHHPHHGPRRGRGR
jgi:hypothetical protein